MVAAATIAAINNTVGAQHPPITNKTPSFGDASNDADKNVNNNLANLEIIKSMLLTQMENASRTKTSDEERSRLTSSPNCSNPPQQHLHHFNRQSYPLNFDASLSSRPSIQSNTPPSSTASISSSSSSPSDSNNNNSPFYVNFTTAPPLPPHHHHTNDSHLLSQHQHNQSLALYHSNIEQILKLQAMSSNLNASSNVSLSNYFGSFMPNEVSIPSYFSNTSSSYAKSVQAQPQVAPQLYQSHFPQDKKKYEIAAATGALKFECDTDNQLVPCKHRFELEKLRVNVFKLIYNLMPQLITAFSIDIGSVQSTTQIDTLIDYLINNQNSYKTNQI